MRAFRPYRAAKGFPTVATSSHTRVSREGGNVATSGGDSGLVGSGPGWQRVRQVAAAGLLVLAVGVLPVACSSESGNKSANGFTESCRAARNAFQKWYDAFDTAESALTHAFDQWVTANTSTSNMMQGDALTSTVNAYNADLQTAKGLQTTADQALATFNAAMATCNQKGIPAACRAEFAQYQPVVANRTSRVQVHLGEEQPIAAAQQASASQSMSAYNRAVQAQNAAAQQYNDLVNAANISLTPALNDGIQACNQA